MLLWAAFLLRFGLQVPTHFHAGVHTHTHAQVTIIFTDIVGFTNFSASIPADELIYFLNSMYSSFDRVSAKHGVRKVSMIFYAGLGLAILC